MNTIDLNKPASTHNPFVVPAGYFAQVTQQVMKQINEQTSYGASHAEDMAIVRWIPWLGAACVAALVVFFSYFVSPTSVKEQGGAVHAETAQNRAASVQSDEIYDYLMMANASDYTDYESNY